MVNSIILIANNEFYRIIKHPLVVILLGFIVLFSFLIGLSDTGVINSQKSDLVEHPEDPFLNVGINNIIYIMSFIASIIAIFIGGQSIMGDLSSSSITLLTTKPLYRRDIFAGKFIGLTLYVLFLITLIFLFSISSILIFCGGPVLPEEAALRILTCAALVFLLCEFNLGMSMLAGIVIKNRFGANVVLGTFIFFEWLYVMPDYFMYSPLGKLNPFVLFLTILCPAGIDLLHSTQSYIGWLSDSYPYIILFIMGTVAVTLYSCYAYEKIDV